jgi:hypothetical protein
MQLQLDHVARVGWVKRSETQHDSAQSTTIRWVPLRSTQPTVDGVI